MIAKLIIEIVAIEAIATLGSKLIMKIYDKVNGTNDDTRSLHRFLTNIYK